ncbi:MAG: beta-1,6-N-acetylglucosaminyltransferase [Xenococcaceae cyanobacterium MO_188.B32]|nr:beta-1,6-N-acetylglucosaminyltransferase [Xenococcaceae cyanobacterium MO_188.B32]
MRHAFLIQAHRNFEQIKLLVDDIISDDKCSVYLHVDLKNDILYQKFKKYYVDSAKVTIIDEREPVYWADFSQVKATLILLKNAVSKSYDYYSLISGQDYIIKPLQEFNDFLEKNNGLEFIEAKKRNNTWRVQLTHRHTQSPKFRRYRYYRYYTLLLAILQYQKKPYVNQYEIYFGSSWFTLTKSAVKYILDFVNKNSGFMADFETSTCGDEHFFQTILINSKFAHRIYNDNLRFIEFKTHRNSPDILTINNYEELINSPKFIARKFDIETDTEVIEKLRSKLVNTSK